MNKSGLPYSGCYSSFLSTISILNLQLLISTQFTDQECLNWEKALRFDLEKASMSIITDPLIERLKEAPLFILNELWLSSLSSSIINFTSTTEHYIKDIVELSLLRNDKPRKSAFSQVNFSASELEEFNSLDELKKKLLKSISAEQSKGQLFSGKFKKVNSFLGTKNDNGIVDIHNSLDSIWRLRNKIAHSNKGLLKEFEITTSIGTIVLSKEPTKDEFLYFAIEFLKIVNGFTKSLDKWDNQVLQMWPANAFLI